MRRRLAGTRGTGSGNRAWDEVPGWLESYGKLIELQERLVEREDYAGLGRVLDRKDSLLHRMSGLRGSQSVAQDAPPDGPPADLRDVLAARVEVFAGREKICLEKALALRNKLAGQLRLLQEGKKLLRGYRRFPSGGKARFKDLKT
jgi:hypothetical protein